MLLLDEAIVPDLEPAVGAQKREKLRFRLRLSPRLGSGRLRKGQLPVHIDEGWDELIILLVRLVRLFCLCDRCWRRGSGYCEGRRMAMGKVAVVLVQLLDERPLSEASERKAEQHRDGHWRKKDRREGTEKRGARRNHVRAGESSKVPLKDNLRLVKLFNFWSLSSAAASCCLRTALDK